jgi:hypothetical protein
MVPRSELTAARAEADARRQVGRREKAEGGVGQQTGRGRGRAVGDRRVEDGGGAGAVASGKERESGGGGGGGEGVE